VDAILGSVAALLVFAGGVIMGRRAGDRRARRTAVTRVDAHLEGREERAQSALRRDVDLSAARLEATNDLVILDRVLRDIRDIAQADECIFWRWMESRDTLMPSAWSTEGPRPASFRTREWAPLVKWSAEQRQVQVAEDDKKVVLVAAAVKSEARLLGVLTLSSVEGLPMGREGAHDWLPRFADQVSALIELLDLRREYGLRLSQSQALVDAVQQLQDYTSAEALAQAICATAVDVATASGAALVRWMAEDQRGLVQAAAGTVGVAAGAKIDGTSLVGRACMEGLPIVLSDARSETSSLSLFHPSGTASARGSLAIVPIVHGKSVIGAIVVEAENPDDIGQYEARNVELVAAVTRGSLEIVWEVEEMSMRARTDALTGLSNRRDFDEQLGRVIAETDRFGGSCSLIVADIDHFKAVNDSHGHEAGDTVLKHVAKTLCESIRTVDVCARYGGEEIAILLPQTETKGAVELAERLRQRLEERPAVVGNAPIRVTASFGVATYPDPVPYGDWLFMGADRALYAAKDAGRNCVKVITARDVTTKLYKKGIS
jgi:two-component system cell cycle response regulator